MFFENPEVFQCAANSENQDPRAFLHLQNLKLYPRTYFENKNKLHTLPIDPGIVPTINELLSYFGFPVAQSILHDVIR